MSHQLFDHDFAHQRAVAAAMDTADAHAKTSLGDIVKEARALNLPWAKIFTAIATAAAGGFSPAAIAAAIAILFGTNVPASLKTAAAG